MHIPRKKLNLKKIIPNLPSNLNNLSLAEKKFSPPLLQISRKF